MEKKQLKSGNNRIFIQYLPFIFLLVMLQFFLVSTITAAVGTTGNTAMPKKDQKMSYVYDSINPSEDWRYGNEVVSRNPNGLTLQGYAQEVTLSGTAVHPDNLQDFTVSLRWKFGEKGEPSLTAGWGKRWEWDSLDECPVQFIIGRDGKLSVKAGSAVLGNIRLAAGGDGIYNLSFTKKLKQIIVHTESEDLSFKLPKELKQRSGYFMLGIQNGIPREMGVQVYRVEIDYEGDEKPLSEEERDNEIQTWAMSRLEKNEALLERYQEHIREQEATGKWGHKTDLSVSPGLIQPGETVTIRFYSKDTVGIKNTAQVQPCFLSESPDLPETVNLNWRPYQNGKYEATVTLNPKKTGNWRVLWQAGDETLSRIFAVVDTGYVACRLLVTTHKNPIINPGKSIKPEVFNLIHEWGLAADYWSFEGQTSPFSKSPEGLLLHYSFFSRNRHLWGDRVMPNGNANWFIAKCPDANLWRFNDKVQHKGITQAIRLWEILGIGPLDILASYTPGHNTPRIARELGVKVLDSFCPWQNWRDGGSNNNWLINNLLPFVPYYIADDDFRKVASGQSILGFPQYTGSNVRLYDIMTAEGQPQLNFRRTHGEDMGETSNIDRFETTVDLLLKEAEFQKGPLFVSIGLENFRNSPDWSKANRLGVSYLIEKAKNKKLVFVSAVDVADYYQRHYPSQPENQFVWPDVYAGQKGWYKPRQLADRIEVNNTQFYTVHYKGQTLPKYFWDYTYMWNEPVWDDQKEIRKKHGLIDPELVTSENYVPRMVNLENVRSRVDMDIKNGEVTLTALVYSPKPLSFLPVAAWNVPLNPVGLEVEETSGDTRYLTVVDGSTSNAHGLIVCNNVPKGTSEWKVNLKGEFRRIINPDVTIGNDVSGRMFIRDEIPHIYLWLTDSTSPEGVLHVEVQSDRKVKVHYNDGTIKEAVNGKLLIEIDNAWQHESPLLIGMTGEELHRAAVFEPLTQQNRSTSK